MRKRYRLTVLAVVMTLLCAGCSGIQEDSLKQFSQSVQDKIQKAGKENSVSAAPSVSEGNYAYEQLTEEEKIVYDEVLAAIMDYEDSVIVSTTERDVLYKAYDYVRADYGGLFWVDGYNYVESTWLGQIISLEFAPSYTMTKTERDKTQEEIDVRVEQLMGGVSNEDSDYQKARFVYDTLINTVVYDSDAENNQNIISVFLEGRTVCQGYASATQYLMDRFGIPCTIISGEAGGEKHSWNLIMLDGEYYYMDVTWGDSSSSDVEEGSGANYDYFAATTKRMNETHTPDGEIPLPECDATQDSYYVQEGYIMQE